MKKNEDTWRVCEVVTLMAKHLLMNVNNLTLFLYNLYKKWYHMTNYDVIMALMTS